MSNESIVDITTNPPVVFAGVAGARAPVNKVYSMHWDEFCERIGDHKAAADKNSVAGWVPADIEPGPRTAERIKAVTMLVMDIEGKAEGQGAEKHLVGPAAPEMGVLVQDIVAYKWAACLVSTYSHKLNDLGPRYRAIFPLSRPLDKAELKPLMHHVADLLGLHQSLDPASAEANRLFYLPTCAEERLPYAERMKIEGEAIDVDALLRTIGEIKKHNKVPRRISDPAKRDTFAKRVRHAFNDAHDIGMILEKHGYKPNGRGKWQCPGSTSGMYGVNKLGKTDVVWSHHTSDPLHGKAHDAFGAWTLLECGDDYRRALYEAAIMLDIELEGTQYLAGVLSLDEMVERFVFRSNGSHVYDRLKPRTPMSWNDFVRTYSASRSGDKPTTNVWVAEPRRLTVNTETFNPGAGEFCESPSGHTAINSWGTGFRRDGTGDAALAEPFIEHVKFLFGDRAEDFLDFLAHIEQKPGERPHSGWLHISSGVQGTGRGWLGELLAKVFQGFCAPEVDLHATLEGDFNGQLSRKVLCIVPEIKDDGQSSNSVSSKINTERLKSLITAPVRNINEKHLPVKEEFNAARWWVCSNFDNAMPLSMADRRFNVVTFHGNPKTPDYYIRLYGLLEDEVFVQSVAKWLGERDISHFNPGALPPMTEAKKAILFEAQSTPTQKVIEWSEGYKYPLATTDHFMDAIGLTTTSTNPKALNYTIREAGWSKINGRYVIEGEKKTLYCRTHDGEKFCYRLPSLDGLIGPIGTGLSPSDDADPFN